MGPRVWRGSAVHDLVKCLETYVGGNVKVSEWPIQCTVASGRTGPRSLVVFIWHTRRKGGGGDREEAKRDDKSAARARFPRSVDLLLHRDRSVRKRRRPSGGKSIVDVDIWSQRYTPGLQGVTSPFPSSSHASVDFLLCLTRFLSINSFSYLLNL